MRHSFLIRAQCAAVRPSHMRDERIAEVPVAQDQLFVAEEVVTFHMIVRIILHRNTMEIATGARVELDDEQLAQGLRQYQALSVDVTTGQRRRDGGGGRINPFRGLPPRGEV